MPPRSSGCRPPTITLDTVKQVARQSAAARAVTRFVVLLVGLGLTLTSCANSSASQGKSAATGVHAATLNPPIAKPVLNLTDTSGRAYDLQARTKGRLTLMYFGYTHCPDECPTTMADIAIALKQLAGVRARTTVVFVTTDPARDSPAVLKKWLAHYPGVGFVGLTGPIKTIYAAADKVGVPLQAPQRKADGSYVVNHGTQVLAFGTDGKAHAVFTAQSSSDDYAHDLPLLLQGTTP